MRRLDITGQRFGRLVAVRFVDSQTSGSASRKAYWLFRCDCGTEKRILGYDVRRGNARSCGCHQKDFLSRTTHGMRRSRIYNIYANILSRCNNIKTPCYHYYGGRGIKVLWTSFTDFKNDMYDSYIEHVEKDGEKNTTIERIDNSGHYCRENCRWATLPEQARNKRTNHVLSFLGKAMPIIDWAKEMGVGESTLRRRIALGWPVESVLITPVRRMRPRLTNNI